MGHRLFDSNPWFALGRVPGESHFRPTQRRSLATLASSAATANPTQIAVATAGGKRFVSKRKELFCARKIRNRAAPSADVSLGAHRVFAGFCLYADGATVFAANPGGLWQNSQVSKNHLKKRGLYLQFQHGIDFMWVVF